MAAQGRALVGGVLVVAAYLAVLDSARADLAIAPDALPRMRALYVDQAALATLDAPAVRRLRGTGATIVADPALPPDGAERLERLAARARLSVFQPLRPAGATSAARVAAAAATCLQRKRSAAGTRCTAVAQSEAEAGEMARSGAIDVALVSAGSARVLRRLAARVTAGRVLAVARIGRAGVPASSVRAVQRSRAVDLALRFQNRGGRQQALRVLNQRAGRPAAPPAMPSGLVGTAQAAGSAILTWTRRGRSADHGVYRDGGHVATTAGTSATVTALPCGATLLEVDAVDRGGGRSAKRALLFSPRRCNQVAGRPTPFFPRPVVRPAPSPRPTPTPTPTSTPTSTPTTTPTSTPTATPTSTPTPTPSPDPEPDLGEAHLWMDPDGGTCLRSEKPADYDDADACATAAEAYARAAETSEAVTVRIRGGAYTPFRIKGGRRVKEWVRFVAALGEEPVFGGGYIELGDSDVRSSAVDHVALESLSTALHGEGRPNPENRFGVYVSPFSEHVRLEDMRAGNFLIQAAEHVSVIGGEFGPCRAADVFQECEISKIDHWPDAPTPRHILIDGAYFHDYDLGPSCFLPEDGGTSTGTPDCHWRALYVNGVHDFTLRNSRFRENFIAAWLTISGEDAALSGNRNVLIENNVFGTGVTYGTPGNYAAREYTRWESFDFAWCQNTEPGSLTYENVTYRFNSSSNSSGPQTLFSEAGCETNVRNVQVYGNVGILNGCDPLVAYSYNVWSDGGTCDPTDREALADGRLPFYADDVPSPEPGDFSLTGPPAAPDDLVPFEMGCPETDHVGTRRGANGFCDAGAYERTTP